MSPGAVPPVAVILAAGRGSRLLPLTQETPKCLLDVGRGRTPLDLQIEAYTSSGVTEILVVAGFRADRIRAHVGASACLILNEEYATTNSLFSLALARPRVADRPFLLSNGDVLFHPGMLRRLLEFPAESALAMDRDGGRGPEEMKIRAPAGQVEAISKQLPAGEADGENVGLLRFGPEGSPVLLSEAARLVEAGQVNAWAPAAYAAFVQHLPLHACDVTGIPWIEIDTPEDLERARSVVFPALPAAREESQPR